MTGLASSRRAMDSRSSSSTSPVSSYRRPVRTDVMSSPMSAHGLLGGGGHRVHHAGLEVDFDDGLARGVAVRAGFVDPVLFDDRVGEQVLGRLFRLVGRNFARQEEQPGRPNGRDGLDAEFTDLREHPFGMRVAEAFLGSDINTMNHWPDFRFWWPGSLCGHPAPGILTKGGEKCDNCKMIWMQCCQLRGHARSSGVFGIVAHCSANASCHSCNTA